MYEEGDVCLYSWTLVLGVQALLISSVFGLFCSLRRAYKPVLVRSLSDLDSHILWSAWWWSVLGGGSAEEPQPHLGCRRGVLSDALLLDHLGLFQPRQCCFYQLNLSRF